MADYSRDPEGLVLDFHGMDLVNPVDRIPEGKYAYAQNVRRYLGGGTTSRATQDSTSYTLPSAVHSLRRLNDLTPAGPALGFVIIGGASDKVYANAVQVDSGYSGNQISLLPFRPNASVQPWMYCFDSQKSGKVRSDGLRYRVGIAEPQVAPTITALAASNTLSIVGAVQAQVWGDSPHSGPTGEYIWKNASDPVTSGIVRASIPPNVTSSGSSLIFDRNAPGNQQNPMLWTVYVLNSGTVSTDDIGTHNVHWVSGSDFGNLSAGQQITINNVPFTIATVPTNILLTVTTAVGTQTNVSYSATSQQGTTPVFQPALEKEGFSDFNMVVTATLFVPAAGTYNMSLTSKDDCTWGIGSTASGNATWPAPGAGQSLSILGSIKTAINGYPLLPRPNYANSHNSTGFFFTVTVPVTFSAAGNYPIELNYDYWFHTGRTLIVQANGADLAPIPGAVIASAQYRYVYRSSATGAKSNPSPPSPQQSLAALSNALVATPSTDPQVDKIDWYRLDAGLLNYTYVGTGPNTTAPFTDTLLDTDIAANPILEFDNYEPFPSIDLPRKGVVNVSGGVATWVSGDLFNTRWLPGTIIVVGTVAYTLDKRPTSTTTLTATNTVIIGGIATVQPLASGTGLTYEIAQPDLASQQLPYVWGPTDNINFAFGCGDPLRPGTLYWCKGSNLDSAPQTNQQDLTSPSEPLQNGAMVAGLGVVMSTERGWVIQPNFFDALATVEGTIGSTWTLQDGGFTRGLYIPRCIAIDGGGRIFYRGKDGVYVSMRGGPEQSITDADLYNLFVHEGEIPQPVTRAGFVCFPPDDTDPHNQRFACANGYLYYDYQDVNNVSRTLVYDIIAGGWVFDVYQHAVAVHALEEGPNVNNTIVGCTDGTVRPMALGGNETATSVAVVPADTKGDARADKHWGDIYIEAAPGLRSQ
jgi:hypothetical protein